MTVIKTMKKINTKIPGILPPPPKTEIDGKVIDLPSKSVPILLELRDRQLKLLNNKNFIAKLPDKGLKIQGFLDKILSELNVKEEQDHTCKLFKNMQISEINKQTIENVEWEGKIHDKRDNYLDSDDDSEPEDVMHILSQCTAQEKTVKVIEPEKTLVTPEDLIKIGDIPHVRYLVEISETNNPGPKPTGQFKPFKTTKSDVHNPIKELPRIQALSSKHKNWEVTAATPPPSIHGPAKILNLEESLNLQQKYNAHLKEIEAENAAAKLLLRSGIKMATLPKDTTKFGSYRDADSDDSEASDPEGSDKEVHDEEPERGGVIFTVMK